MTINYTSSVERVSRDPNIVGKDVALATDLADFYDDPLGYVMYSFPWHQESSGIQMVLLPPRFRNRFDSEYGPDLWACDFLDELGQEIRIRGFNGRDAVAPIRFATTSGHGIGKSVLVAWIANFLKDTRPFSKGTVTANTAEQLKTKTWAEIGRWAKLAPTFHWFTYSAVRGSMTIKHKDNPETWRLDAQTCREENSESFAGQHAANSSSYYINDEDSGVPEKIHEVQEGGLSDGEPMTFAFGNPTRNSGYFHKIFTDKKIQKAGAKEVVYKGKTIEVGRWICRQIDSRSVSITNKDKIEADRITFGEDSDFFKVRWRGMFPDLDQLQFIHAHSVEEAQGRQFDEYSNRQFRRTMGVDVAGSTDGDEFVLYSVKGNDARSFPAKRYRGLRPSEVQSHIIAEFNFFASIGDPIEACFIDTTGGYGSGPADALRLLGYPVIDVSFGKRAFTPKTYVYIVDEIWGRMRVAVETNLCLPDDYAAGWEYGGSNTGSDLKTQLTDRWYGITLGGQNRLETKRDMRDRGVQSPDIADALSLNFYQPMAFKANTSYGGSQQVQIARDIEDPFSGQRAD